MSLFVLFCSSFCSSTPFVLITLEPDPPVTFDLGITLLPDYGIPAVLRRR
jgi:hypothetical protein